MLKLSSLGAKSYLRLPENIRLLVFHAKLMSIYSESETVVNKTNTTNEKSQPTSSLDSKL